MTVVRSALRRTGNVRVLVVLLLALWVLSRTVRYLLGAEGLHSYHVETAAFIFVVAGLTWRWWQSSADATASPSPAAAGAIAWAVFVGAAFLLYAPALSLGFFSDDFALAARASAWNVGPMGAQFFRPLPMLLWAVMLKAGVTASAFHALNIALHGTNAYLASRVVGRWVGSRITSLLAGFLVLTAPLAVEAVVWSAGVFDLTAGFFILTAILAARGYNTATPAARRLLFLSAGIAAILSKETAVVGFGFVVIDAWIRRAWPKRLLVDVSLLGIIASAVALVRLATAFDEIARPVTRYMFQRAVFGSFGSFGVPWHAEVVNAAPWLAIAYAAVVIALLAKFFSDRTASERETKTAVGSAAWILLSIVPVATILYVPPDLQGSRYLYLATVGWAGLLATLAHVRTRVRWIQLLSYVTMLVLIAMGAYGVRRHVHPWQEAAALRDRVVGHVSANHEIARCRVVSLSDLPDSIRGAFVFRHGATELFAKEFGLQVSASAPPECQFRWEQDSGFRRVN